MLFLVPGQWSFYQEGLNIFKVCESDDLCQSQAVFLLRREATYMARRIFNKAHRLASASLDDPRGPRHLFCNRQSLDMLGQYKVVIASVAESGRVYVKDMPR